MKKKMCHWCGQDNGENITECECCGENLTIEAKYDLIDLEDENKVPDVNTGEKSSEDKN